MPRVSMGETLVSRDMFYCFPLADVLCMDPEQDGRVFVCVFRGGDGG